MADATTLRALLLDFGGVLVLHRPGPRRQHWLRRLGRQAEEFDRWLWNTPMALAALRGEVSGGEFWRAIGAELGLSADDSAALHRDYFAADQLNRRALQLARLARAQGKRVGLLSNAYSDLRPILAAHGVVDVFDDIVNSSDFHVTKPDAAIYMLACQRLSVRPPEALFIDDSITNVEGARSAGLVALQYVGDDTMACAAAHLALPWPQ